MFCNQCGTNVPDGTAFCSNCGAAMSGSLPVTVEAKKSKLPIMITFALSMLLVIVSVISPFATAFYDIPVFSMILGSEMENFEEEWEEIADEWEDTHDEIDLDELDLTREEEEAFETFLKKADKMMEKPSLMNVNGALKAAEALEDVDGAEHIAYEVAGSAEEMEAVTGVLWVVSIVVFLPAAVLALVAGLTKKFGVTIAAMILTALAQLILSGWLLLILSLAVNITQIVLQKKYAAAQ